MRGHAEETYVTSAEVYQEVVRRYVAIDRRPAIDDCFALLDDLVQEVYPITRADVLQARTVSQRQRHLSGRGCLHVAVMERRSIARILTFDAGFDLWPGLTRFPG